ncbi:MAG: peptidase M20 [Deltaproteobacteria bacterium]|nr:peptidase M20 [Deltaproteobacteria bacterium]
MVLVLRSIVWTRGIGLLLVLGVFAVEGACAAEEASARAALPRRAVSRDQAVRVDAWVEHELPRLLEIYRDLHAHPELSLEEERTARIVAKFLGQRGYRVESGIGGHGVLGVLENGDGPTLLIRGDMDGLPVTEATGLPFASRVRTMNADGVSVGTMHACGHDVHTTNLLGTAQLLASLQGSWQGTVVILAQPAEELGRGALMMIEDGLFDRIPLPDHGIALHVAGELPSGRIGFVSGWAAANVDSVDITIHGRGGHGARPHQTNDPIVTAAHVISALQTIVSRRVDPSESAVVTVGSIHGGTKSNVIPDEVELALTVRSYTDEVRHQLLDGIREITRETCEAFGCPRPPDIAVRENNTPAMYNDPALVAHGVEVFRAFLGEGNVQAVAATMTGEDFGRYTRRAGFPTFLYRLGSVEPSRWQAAEEGGEPLPSLHSSHFVPDAEATLQVGLRSMGRLALSLLGER